MARTVVWALVAVVGGPTLVAGCGGDYGPQFNGSPVWQMFPFDGERTWDYINTDTTLPHKLIGTSVLEPEVIGGVNVYTVQYVKECVGADPACVEGELVRKIRWSSTVSDGVFIHGYDIGAGIVDLVPPVQVTEDTMERGDVLETESGGIVWSSTMNGIEQCPIKMTADWPECGSFTIAADVGDGYPVAGDLWATKGNGIAAMQLATETGQWQLSDVDCQGDCDGKW
ncbi:MAG: hypothetical protein ABMB14_37920 [Myxococcota bacterium]